MIRRPCLAIGAGVDSAWLTARDDRREWFRDHGQLPLQPLGEPLDQPWAGHQAATGARDVQLGRQQHVQRSRATPGELGAGGSPISTHPTRRPVRRPIVEARRRAGPSEPSVAVLRCHGMTRCGSLAASNGMPARPVSCQRRCSRRRVPAGRETTATPADTRARAAQGSPFEFTVEGPISAVSLDQVGRPDPWTAHRRADTMAPPRNPALHPAVVVEVAVAAVDPEAAGEDQAARRTCW